MRLVRQTLLTAAALDSAFAGAWAVFRPTDLVDVLQRFPSADGLLLCRLLGVLYLIQTGFLLIAAFGRDCGELALVPLFGRLLSCGVWLWLLGAGRTPAADGALVALLAHDVVWPPVLAALFWSIGHGASSGPAVPWADPVPPA